LAKLTQTGKNRRKQQRHAETRTTTAFDWRSIDRNVAKVSDARTRTFGRQG
jgi:hypothetical protein